MATGTDLSFPDAVRGLLNGDFSRLEPLFEWTDGTPPPPVVRWHEAGLFDAEPQALAEALSCACFNGRIRVADYLLSRGVDPSGGAGTGLNAVHWAANRGQLAAVELLLRHQAPLEAKNSHGGTVLDCAVWSALNEPKPDHLKVIEALAAAGADVAAVRWPTGDAGVDEVLSRYGAGAESR